MPSLGGPHVTRTPSPGPAHKVLPACATFAGIDVPIVFLVDQALVVKKFARSRHTVCSYLNFLNMCTDNRIIMYLKSNTETIYLIQKVLSFNSPPASWR